jgi:transcriptional regulator with XRE-family HTH domain
VSTLGQRLRIARKNKGYSQVYVREITGINNKTLSSYETDYSKPDIDTLAKLAELYEVSLDYLITGKEEEKKEDKSGVCEEVCSELRELLRKSDIALDGIPLTEEERLQIDAVLTALFWQSRNKAQNE